MRADADSFFAARPVTPAEHFRVHYYAAVLAFIDGLSATQESLEKTFEQFPFLAGYTSELAEFLEGRSTSEALVRWSAGIEAWERGAVGHLPLRALREATGLDQAGLVSLLLVGLGEEDPRFGAACETLQGTPGQRRPTLAFLQQGAPRALDGADVASLLSRWRAWGLVQVTNPEAPRQEWLLRIPGPVWDALRGDEPDGAADWARHQPATELLSFEQLLAPLEVRRAVEALPPLIQSGAVRVVFVRGPRHNGRHTTLGALAGLLNCGLLTLRGLDKPDDPRWREASLLAVLLKAMPVIEFELAPGETATLPAWPLTAPPLGVVMGNAGGLGGELAAHAATVCLELPDPEMRREHWQRSLRPDDQACLAEVSRRFRLSAGNIHRAAPLARVNATLARKTRIDAADVLEATRTLNRQSLDVLARRVPTGGDLTRLCVGPRTRAELDHLERRCRHRERLPGALAGLPGGPLDCGVRALLCGPSGTGKTLAARLLAGALSKDLYRLDLAAIVNKYIGETEKNLNRVLDLAEALDVILLLDEGDALLTRRTDVQTANDRYANLETNFLLQRLEGFEGILLVTTNARERLDPAFERRMDVVVEFHLPNAEERWQLWQAHLPAACTVADGLLAEIAAACELTGGQIRNAALHAALLALDNGGVVSPAYLEAAVRREYVKLGAVCPLRRSAAIGASHPG